MPSQHEGEVIRWAALNWAKWTAMILMFLCFTGAAVLLARAYLHQFEGNASTPLSPSDTAPSVALPQPAGQLAPAQAQGAPIPAVTPPPLDPSGQSSAITSQAQPTKYPFVYIGVVAGHWQYDSGAVCSDGLREVDITLPVAQRVAAMLRWLGYQVDLLGEYDVALIDYQADTFISIHADSCGVPGASGFKVARVENSFVPEQEDRLVDCLWQSYAAATGLAPHQASITSDMRNYHAFRKISPHTPGAIIEMGFMLDDRWLLESRQEDIALGIVEGIVCFLEGR